MKKLILILMLFLGCEKEPIEVDCFLNITTYEIISNPSTTYAKITYKAKPYSRVFWTSPDTVIIEDEKTCIVCCSTITFPDSTGFQLAILPDNYIGKTWTVIGYINEEVADTIYIK